MPELCCDLLQLVFGDAPVGEGGASPVVVDEPARRGCGVEVVGEGVQGVEEACTVVGVAYPGSGFAVGVAGWLGGQAKEIGGVGDAAGRGELDQRDRGGAAQELWIDAAQVGGVLVVSVVGQERRDVLGAVAMRRRPQRQRGDGLGCLPANGALRSGCGGSPVGGVGPLGPGFGG